MNQEKTETQEWPRADEHPWLAQMPPSEDEDSVGVGIPEKRNIRSALAER